MGAYGGRVLVLPNARQNEVISLVAARNARVCAIITFMRICSVVAAVIAVIAIASHCSSAILLYCA